jgi:hypothetical protein
MNDADAAKRSVSYFTEGNFFYALTPSPVNVEPSDTGLFEDRRGADDRLGAIPCPCDAPGDVVTVTRIDRLARSTFDLFAIVKQIVDAKAQFRSLAEPWADTGTSTGRLMIAVLGGLADVERDLIRTRTAEGRSRAQKNGQRMGRKPKLTEEQQAEARKRRAEGATLTELARSYGVGRSTISRLKA